MFLVYVAKYSYGDKHLLKKCVFTTLTILIIFAIVENTIVYKVLKVEKTYKPAAFFEYDLAGIMAKSGAIYAERLLLPEFKDQTAIRKIYLKYKGSWRIIKIFGMEKKREGRVYQNIFNKKDVNFLFLEWIKAVIHNPSSYLKHRFKAISLSFGFQGKFNGLRYDSSFKQKINKHGLKKDDNLLWKMFKKYNNQFQSTIFFRPWFWFIMNIMIFISTVFIMYFHNIPQWIVPYAALNSSGSLFYFVYLFIGLSADCRIVYWGMVATALSTFSIGLTLITFHFLKNGFYMKNR